LLASVSGFRQTRGPCSNCGKSGIIAAALIDVLASLHLDVDIRDEIY
jgi:hypothetical protein